MKRIIAVLGATIVAIGLVAPAARADYGFTGETLNQWSCFKENPITSTTFLRLVASLNGNPAVTVAEFGPEAVKQDATGDCPAGFPYYAEMSWVPTQPGTYVVTACLANRLSEARTVCAEPFAPTIVTDLPPPIKCKNKKTGKVKVFHSARCPSGYVKAKK